MSRIEKVEKELHLVEAAATLAIRLEKERQRFGSIETYVRAQLPQDCQALVLSMVEMFAAEQVKVYEIRYPRDWWEALKDRWAPVWFSRRYPVVYRTHVIDIKVIWQGFKPDPETLKFGPFLPHVLYRWDAPPESE